ncbi:MAG: thymidine phosphorylase [Planctomycetes bacterium]|nr:thymidine phosphorylase [Planctomycetota bacterium]
MALPQEIIRKKRDGAALERGEVEEFVRGASGAWDPEQLAAMLMAIFFRGMDAQETAWLTEAMMRSGTVLELREVAGRKVDKHSTGGVGDKISVPLAPLVAACGVPVPMISGRGLGHTGGTLDKLESIPGFRTNLDARAFADCVARHGLCLIGQTDDLAPADRRLYALRDVTATVECIPLIVSSILSKKLAEGIDALVLDVKFGSGAFMAEIERSRELARALVRAAHAMGKGVAALLTDMSAPLGHAIGNANEIQESIDVLRGGGPADVRELTLVLGAEMLRLGGVESKLATATARLERALASGEALQKFAELIEAQGGDPRVIDDPLLLPRAPHEQSFLAEREGYLHVRDCRQLGIAALELGAGRRRASDRVDAGVGLEMQVRAGTWVHAGDELVRIAHRGVGVEAADRALRRALVIEDEAPAAHPLILERIEVDDGDAVRSTPHASGGSSRARA